MLDKMQTIDKLLFRFLYIDHDANQNNNEFTIEQMNKRTQN